MEKLNYIATSTFGLEASVKREVTKLGYEITSVSDGRIDFSGDLAAIAEANLWLRCADRVLLNVGEFTALTFDELFEGTKALAWEKWITKDAKFTVTGKSVKSKLFSVSDCQAIVKKAVVERLKKTYHVDWFEETGPEYKIQVGLLRDKVTLTIDTTGPGLHKRGYREHHAEAPIKETLAAALIELSYFRKDRILLDPMCGSGTIPIEAALMARNIAPGIKRRFVSETWDQIDKNIWKTAREKAKDSIDKSTKIQIYGSDIDGRAGVLAMHNAKRAGVADCITFDVKDLKDVTLPGNYGIAICNPPYGERIGKAVTVEALYRQIGKTMSADDTWSVYVLTSYEEFERLYEKRADAKRKLFNGMIKTDYFQFLGPRPPKTI
ncbi:MAG: class I SAM-dependent RNA methyltransferase [Defluviitaleaceae bacterium]|nr:class I SAM-dependent RNA methyltransferase [Defluviitaleaceae bacterium]